MGDVAMDGGAIGLFLISAVALLGSPGPGIASLVFVARSEGLARGLGYYAGLQLGSALVAAAAATGLVSLLAALPGLSHAIAIIATLYLLSLAYAIARAPLGALAAKPGLASSPLAGLLFGVTNPKAYLCFASLMAMAALVPGNAAADGALKWSLSIPVMLVVDLAWVLFGVSLRRAGLPPKGERALNLALAAMIVGAALMILL
jgi:threonine/homoserine/homoserine lactone efflux protein